MSLYAILNLVVGLCLLAVAWKLCASPNRRAGQRFFAYAFIVYLLVGCNLHYGFPGTRDLVNPWPLGFFGLLLAFQLYKQSFRGILFLVWAGLAVFEFYVSSVFAIVLQVGLSVVLALGAFLLATWWERNRKWVLAGET